MDAQAFKQTLLTDPQRLDQASLDFLRQHPDKIHWLNDALAMDKHLKQTLTIPPPIHLQTKLRQLPEWYPQPLPQHTWQRWLSWLPRLSRSQASRNPSSGHIHSDGLFTITSKLSGATIVMLGVTFVLSVALITLLSKPMVIQNSPHHQLVAHVESEAYLLQPDRPVIPIQQATFKLKPFGVNIHHKEKLNLTSATYCQLFGRFFKNQVHMVFQGDKGPINVIVGKSLGETGSFKEGKWLGMMVEKANNNVTVIAEKIYSLEDIQQFMHTHFPLP